MTDEFSDDLDEVIQEKFGSKHEILEAVADLENDLSKDAQLVLRILQEDEED